MKMKTLKDIKPADNFHRNKFSVRNGSIELISKEDLKKEAIEWILATTEQVKSESQMKEDDYLVGWIKHFFNITKKDLIKFIDQNIQESEL